VSSTGSILIVGTRPGGHGISVEAVAGHGGGGSGGGLAASGDNGGAGTRAAKVGEDGLDGKGGLDGGDNTQPAATAGTSENIEGEHAVHQRRPGPGVRGHGSTGAALECVAVRGRATVADERLQAILARAGARFDDVVKQLVYVTDLDAYNASGRAERGKFFGAARAASTGLVVRQLADPAMLVEVELVVDLGGAPAGKPLLEKFNVENHPGDFHQGVIVNGGRMLYLAGQVANNPDGSVAGVGDWKRQAEKVYENIGHVLRAAGATPASAVKETTWVLNIGSWRQDGAPVRRAFYKGVDFPASTLVEIPSLARPEFLVEIEVIAAIA
jgi:enamine deaminase RidA (YjgF/YER057c/UK114 family)